jgi:FlaA1/EpsC-like NDP-sugar epimerase
MDGVLDINHIKIHGLEISHDQMMMIGSLAHVLPRAHLLVPLNPHLQVYFHYRFVYNTLRSLTMPVDKATSRVAIVGIGDVGAAIAYALILNSVCGQILVVDTKEDFRDGQVLDLSDATYRGSSSTYIRAGTYQEAGQCDVVVITAGAKQKQGQLQQA